MKYLDLKGKTVLTAGGRTLGFVSDLLVDVINENALGIVISKRTLTGGCCYMPLKHLKINKGCVIARALCSPLKRRSVKENRELSASRMLNREVKNEKGQVAGRLVDLEFDPSSGELQGVVVSKGFFEDVFIGRNIVPCGQSLELTGSTVVLHNEDGKCSEIAYRKYLRD